MKFHSTPLRALANKILALAAALIILFSVIPVRAAAPAYTSEYGAVLGYLQNGSAPSFGSIGGEWTVLALARSGRVSPDSDYAKAYYASIEAMVRENGSAKLDSTKSTENSRLIIALTSIGRDARSVAGYDLTSPLSDFNYVKRQGINGAIFALIALDSSSAYGMSSTKSSCVSHILERELPGGGWTLMGNNPDPDMTAMAITALSRYSSARPAIDRAVERLSSMQGDDGGFVSYNQACSESCSQVITALSAIGIDAGSDPRFIKNGRSVVDALLGFFTGSGFSHIQGGSTDRMASEQAAYSLCAYDRYKRGRNSLYNMNDVPLGTGEPTPAPTTLPITTPATTPKPTNTPAPIPTPTQAPTPTPMPIASPMITTAPTASPAVSEAPAASDVPTAEPTVSPFPAVSASPEAAASEAAMTDAPTPAAGTDTPDEATDGGADTDGEPRKSRALLFAAAGAIIAGGATLIFVFIKKK